MKKQLFIVILTVLCAAFTSVAQKSREVRSLIEDNEAKFSDSFAKGDAQSVSNLYAEDAAILPPNGAKIGGRANIRNFWQGAYEAGVKKVETKTVEISGNGNSVYELGSYTLYGGKNEVLDEGKYVVVWKKEGKNWLMFRDIWNSDKK